MEQIPQQDRPRIAALLRGQADLLDPSATPAVSDTGSAVAEVADAEGVTRVSVPADGGRGETGADTALENPRLAFYEAQYDRWSDADKAICLWGEVRDRLLGNDGEDLNRAEAMEEGAILFGVDEQGNPLIANGGSGPILTNMNYPNTRNAVLFTEKDGRQVPTGYEMLSNEGEIRAFEAFTGKPVVQPSEGFVPSFQDNGWRGIWCESGDNPVWVRYAYVCPGFVRARLCDRGPQYRVPGLGVRRLLRVLKKS